MVDISNLDKTTLDCIGEAEENFGKFLKSRGLSFTKARKEALKVIYSFESHFDLDELKERFKDMEVSFHFTSMFRILNLLVEAGMLMKLKSNTHRKVAYECTLCRHHHDHMICNECGDVIEFHNDEIEKLQEMVAQQHNFKMLYHSLTITGLCEKCHSIASRPRKKAPSHVIKQVL